MSHTVQTQAELLAATLRRAEAAERALIECAKWSGEEVEDDRAPTWPPITEWAVGCVRELREEYDAHEDIERAERAEEQIGRLGEALRRMIAATELSGTRSEIALDVERAKTFARAVLDALKEKENP